mmetsp:Transcript_45582/g.76719  ORF Transcript_45582/g.76719 Transcript_45582/m.76719 type:complete len:263 (+) Transcript_45582:1132-1920(+)
MPPNRRGARTPWCSDRCLDRWWLPGQLQVISLWETPWSQGNRNQDRAYTARFRSPQGTPVCGHSTWCCDRTPPAEPMHMRATHRRTGMHNIHWTLLLNGTARAGRQSYAQGQFWVRVSGPPKLPATHSGAQLKESANDDAMYVTSSRTRDPWGQQVFAQAKQLQKKGRNYEAVDTKLGPHSLCGVTLRRKEKPHAHNTRCSINGPTACLFPLCLTPRCSRVSFRKWGYFGVIIFGTSSALSRRTPRTTAWNRPSCYAGQPNR